MREFEVYGRISFFVSLDIKANTEEEAMAEAKEQLSDFYHLDVRGADHDPNKVVYDLDLVEYEDEEYEGLCVCIESREGYIEGKDYGYYRYLHDYYVNNPLGSTNRTKMSEEKFLYIFKNKAEIREERIDKILE
jgi:hypothetical protein